MTNFIIGSGDDKSVSFPIQVREKFRALDFDGPDKEEPIPVDCVRVLAFLPNGREKKTFPLYPEELGLDGFTLYVVSIQTIEEFSALKRVWAVYANGDQRASIHIDLGKSSYNVYPEHSKDDNLGMCVWSAHWESTCIDAKEIL